MRKFMVALGLALLTIPQKISRARLIIEKMTGNTTFPNPDPPLADIGTATDELETAKSEVESVKNTLAEKVAAQNEKEQVLNELLSNEAGYVDLKAKGDKTKIESAGMPASDEPSPVHLGIVTGLSLTHGDNAGEVDAHWNALKDATGYTVEISTVGPD